MTSSHNTSTHPNQSNNIGNTLNIDLSLVKNTNLYVDLKIPFNRLGN